MNRLKFNSKPLHLDLVGKTIINIFCRVQSFTSIVNDTFCQHYRYCSVLSGHKLSGFHVL